MHSSAANSGYTFHDDFSTIPLVVSVVGHRDPIPGVEKRVCLLFEQDLKSLLAHLPSTPIYMLNGLAAGLDSDAAEVFLKVIKDEATNNASMAEHKLIAALPKGRDLYRFDFHGIYERQRFDFLLSQCDELLEPTDYLPAGLIEQKQSSLKSPECYEQQSLFVVRNCYLLFAFNNGETTLIPGGTSHSVSIQRNEVHPRFSSIDEVITVHEPGALIEYNTPRQSSHGDMSLRTRMDRTYWLDSELKPSIEGIMPTPIKLDQINRHKVCSSSSEKQFNATDDNAGLWKYIDSQANTYKNRYRSKIIILLLIGLLISLTLARPGWQVIGLISIVYALFYFPGIQGRQRQDFIAFRCLSESILVQELWAFFGIRRNVADLFRSQRHLGLSWTRTFLRSIFIQLKIKGDPSELTIEQRIEIIEAWMESQINWLDSKIIIQRRAENKVLVAIFIVCIVGSISSLAMAIYMIDAIDWITELMMALIVIFIAFRELMGFQEINSRYARSSEQLKRGLASFRLVINSASSSTDALPRLRCALEAVGFEKVDELNDWVSDQLKRSYRP